VKQGHCVWCAANAAFVAASLAATAVLVGKAAKVVVKPGQCMWCANTACIWGPEADSELAPVAEASPQGCGAAPRRGEHAASTVGAKLRFSRRGFVAAVARSRRRGAAATNALLSRFIDKCSAQQPEALSPPSGAAGRLPQSLLWQSLGEGGSSSSAS
jgi:hypothetical protein